MIQADAVRHLLNGFDEIAPVEDVLRKYVKHLEEQYAPNKEITLFIFALRCFFSWHRMEGFEQNVVAHKSIRDAWFEQNEGTYTHWLTTNQDDTNILMWAKWTFQAKNSIFDEWIESKSGPNTYQKTRLSE
jgi:hypothetical protein